MWHIYRIYTQLNSGCHTAMYDNYGGAKSYFDKVRKAHPNDYVIWEVLDDDTGNLLARKEFNKPVDADINEVKAMRQEYVDLIKYDIEWKQSQIEIEAISPNEASKIMIDTIGKDGYGTKWMYVIRPCCFVEHIPDPLDNAMDEKGRYLSLMHLY